MSIVEVAGVDPGVREHGTLDQELGDSLWPGDNNGAHTAPAATELNPLKLLKWFRSIISCTMCQGRQLLSSQLCNFLI